MAGNRDRGESLPKSWVIRRLDEVSKIIDSLHQTPQYTPRGYPMVRVTDVKMGFLDLGKALHVTKDVFAKFTHRHIPQRGDIVFSRVGTYGNASYVNTDAPFCLGQNTAVISPEIDSRFLHYCLQTTSVRDQIEQTVVGSTQKTISLKSISGLLIPVPPRREIERVRHILGTLDDKIELNRQMNQTLEAMARAIFKSWFVDFDPVRAKMEGRQPVGMSAEIAALFPDSFEESPLGKIPRGWEAKKIGAIVKRIPVGKKFSQKTAIDSGSVPILDQGKSGIIGYHNEEPGVEASPENPVIVFANHTCYMRLIMHDFSAIQNVLPFKGIDLDIYWVFCATYGKQGFTEYKGHWPDFSINEIVVPGTELIDLFGKKMSGLFKKIFANEEQSRTLAELRDTLLPKFLSGELHVSDIDIDLPEDGQAATIDPTSASFLSMSGRRTR